MLFPTHAGVSFCTLHGSVAFGARMDAVMSGALFGTRVGELSLKHAMTQDASPPRG
jgi:hypothetical protein